MEKGMVKLSVMYPNQDGKKFDLDYYSNQHVSLVAKLLGDSVKSASVEKGLGGNAPDSPAVYIAIGNLYFESMDSFHKSFSPNAEEIMADLPNFTDIEPVVQISEIVL
ncbi:EthD family reductase [Gramella sp. MT6]|uniref:EthD family reductase n=1 Tax=Gramella sp. MT6 TaxID=2705471 RepID=UPI001C749835|nr:EthD family reductase [Gramella sp. MT6]QYA24507.1 EthD family reductase [Gramella sp. MT6]